ncbi:MAG TPA: hypothetical protein DDZ89_11700 [Clostridiales bacterium]|nr:hypothetical protein [Clostridiales bacterium]
MKDFNRENLSLSLCGLNCGLCPMQLGGYCPGCGGGDGNQSCAIAKCSLQHDQVEYCFLCIEFPCSKFEKTTEYDSFITHQRQLEDMKRAKAIGIQAYTKEQVKKREILEKILSEYNDGRRKTFYCVAINLLTLGDIEEVMKQIEENTSFNNLSIKEKAAYIVTHFQRIADKSDVELKLRKKPG